MAEEKIYRDSIGYLAVLNDEHNAEYMKIVEKAIEEQGAGLELSWVYGHDLEEYDEDEIEELLADDPWYMKTLRATGEPDDFLVFFDDETGINLRGASESWVLLVNRILRDLEDYNAQHFGEDSRVLGRFNS